MILSIYVDDRIYRTLHRISNNTGRSIEELAEAAVANEASKTREWNEVLPPARRSIIDMMDDPRRPTL